MPVGRRVPNSSVISVDQARAIAARAQGLAGPPSANGTADDMLRKLGAVQLDTISVLARSHELVAYARLGAVPRVAVEAAYWGQPARAFEYLGHANCILPVESWPFFSFRRRALAIRLSARGGGRLPRKVLAEVRARLAEGPVTASDLGGARTGTAGWWSWSASKRAIETLCVLGEAVCTARRAWKRVYDLPERALPAELVAHDPSNADCFHYLVAQAARALGVATRREIAEYFRLTIPAFGRPTNARALLDQAIEASALIPVEVEGWGDAAFAHPDALRRLPPATPRSVLLSPFDSLIWDRARTARLFEFPMLLEAYKPKDQRVHGYFMMPLLANNALVGRVDVAREGRTFVARQLSLDDPGALDAMATALRDAASWVGCDAVRVDAVTPAKLAAPLRRALR